MIRTLAAVLPLKQRTTAPGRQVILVDIENVVGGAVLTQDAAIWARRQIETVLEVRDDAHIVIGASHASWMNAALAWPTKRCLPKSGPDGADLAILDEMESLLVHRYDEVILVSGDGIFADAVSVLSARGAQVTVVAHHGRCAARLRLAAHCTVYLQTEHNQGTIGGAA
ncbi:NYN domain-containing protein [Mumia sp. DW29H23]|uniref:NYN domain-containing protein n=1 Tax=Mumia sp. DW29H23 TaxID=3421241 RepID=UPI003D683349